MKIFITQKGKKLAKYHFPYGVIASLAIYLSTILLFIINIWGSIYQEIYFTIMDIPKIKKDNYFHYDRWDLSKLSFWQKINCLYCTYANGTVAWFKAVVNQTETYSCAIKHTFDLPDHSHQKSFEKRDKFI